MSSLMVLVPPTRSISRSCSTRSSFACRMGESSPISSSKTVPPSAISSLPFFCAIAPVNAPFSWPNSSLSSSVSASAAQLMATNGPPARRLLRWMARAISSLPVPLSPRIRTLELDGATLAICRCRSRIFALDAQHVVLQLELGLQALVLLLQPAQNGSVLPGARGHSGHCGDQLQVSFVEPARGIGGFEIDHRGHFAAHHHRRAQLRRARRHRRPPPRPRRAPGKSAGTPRRSASSHSPPIRE